MKNKKVIIGVSVVAVIGIAYYLYSSKIKKTSTKNNSGGDSEGNIENSDKSSNEPIAEPISDTVLDATDTKNVKPQVKTIESTPVIGRPRYNPNESTTTTATTTTQTRPISEEPISQVKTTTTATKPVSTTTTKPKIISLSTRSGFSGFSGNDHFEVDSDMFDL